MDGVHEDGVDDDGDDEETTMMTMIVYPKPSYLRTYVPIITSRQRSMSHCVAHSLHCRRRSTWFIAIHNAGAGLSATAKAAIVLAVPANAAGGWQRNVAHRSVCIYEKAVGSPMAFSFSAVLPSPVSRKQGAVYGVEFSCRTPHLSQNCA